MPVNVDTITGSFSLLYLAVRLKLFSSPPCHQTPSDRSRTCSDVSCYVKTLNVEQQHKLTRQSSNSRVLHGKIAVFVQGVWWLFFCSPCHPPPPSTALWLRFCFVILFLSYKHTQHMKTLEENLKKSQGLKMSLTACDNSVPVKMWKTGQDGSTHLLFKNNVRNLVFVQHIPCEGSSRRPEHIVDTAGCSWVTVKVES